MRISALGTKLVGAAVLTGLTCLAVQAIPVQAAVVDRAPQPGQQVAAYRGGRDGTWYGGYGNGRGDLRGAQCGTGGFGARKDRARAMNCAGDRRFDRTPFSPGLAQPAPRDNWGDHRGARRSGWDR